MTASFENPLRNPLFSRPLNFPFPVLVLLVAVLVSGCGLMPGGKAAPTAPSTTAAAPVNPKPSGVSVARATPRPATVPVPEPAPPIPARPEKIYPEPGHLSGLDGGRVLALLGVPKLKRHDEPAEIWQYQTRTCTLHIFLYRAGKGAPFKVRHFETSARGKDGVSEKACFVGLLKAHEQG